MITTDFVPGSPCWLDLGAPDVPAAADFYGSVFGWEFRPYGPDARGYGLFLLGGRSVGGLGPLTEEGARPAWTLYFHTPDADAAARDAERLGGTVRSGPSDVGDGEGRMAHLSDPQGGRFAVWQPGATRGVEAVDQPGALCWTELYTTDDAAAKEFYGALFGWRTEDMPLPGGGGVYALVAPEGRGQERMQGGVMRLAPEHLVLTGGVAYWHPVFAVVDCDAAVAAVTGHGGTTQMGPVDAEGVGRLAVCLDPFGADFVLLTPAALVPPDAPATPTGD